MNTPSIGLIAAIAENGVIGVGGALPWRLSTDMRRFKRLTIGKPIVMGRKTANSLPAPLVERVNIVVTSRELTEAGFIRVTSIEEAISVAQDAAAIDDTDEIMIIGGGQIYASTIHLADRLYITHVAASPEGDTFFPAIDRGDWRATSREEIPAGVRDSHASIFIIYQRAGAGDA